MSDGSERLIFFRARGERYALRLADVAEVMEPPRLYPIPCVPPFFHGVMNFHGSLVSVLDLSAFPSGSAVEPMGQLVVLDGRLANLALGVEEVESIRPADTVEEVGDGEEPLVEKILAGGDGEVKLLSLESLLQDLEELLGKSNGIAAGRLRAEPSGA